MLSAFIMIISLSTTLFESELYEELEDNEEEILERAKELGLI